MMRAIGHILQQITFFAMFLILFFGGGLRLELAFLLALCSLIIAYVFAEKLTLQMFRAKPLLDEKYDFLHQIAKRLAGQMGIPVPRLWSFPSKMANALTAGRTPANSSIAISRGMLDALGPEDFEPIFAHELAHIKNRDIKVRALATGLIFVAGYPLYKFVLPMAVKVLPPPPIGILLDIFFVTPLVILAIPLAILAVCRRREYLADEIGATYLKSPDHLANSLSKIENWNIRQLRRMRAVRTATPDWLAELFSTHPMMEKRIDNLRRIKL